VTLAGAHDAGSIPGPLPDALVAQFHELMARAIAAGEPEPTAMSLATVAGDGRPSVRIVLLKHLDRDGLVFYTNTLSRKGRQLAGQAWAGTAMHWKHLDLQVQVRSEGRVEPVSDQEADAYFQSRPRGSQIGAWASLQSEPLADPAQFQQRIAQAEDRFGDGPVPRPPHWSGYRLRPDRIEFWFGRPYRLHERILHTWQDDNWRQSRLYP